VRLLCSDTEHEEQVKNMAVVGFDAGKDQLTRLDEGWVDGLIVQNPYGMGFASVVAAARTILGESNESVVDTGYVWVTPDNMTNQEISNVLYE
jgi:ribose transport system substrate-binding protein